MLTLIIMIFLTLAIVGFVCYSKTEHDGWFTSAIIGFVVSSLVSIGLIYCISMLATSNRYDKCIAIYEEENIILETKIEDATQLYLERREVFYDLDKLKVDTLLIAFPELKNNDVITQQIDAYIQNSNAVKKLKVEQTNVTMWKFLVYFGN